MGASRKVLDFGGSRAKIGDMKTPSVKKGFSCTGRYRSDVKTYGKPPKGFRFLEVGETSDPETDYFLLFGYESWAKETVPTKIDDTLYLFIRRAASKVAKTAAPKVTMKDLLARIEALEKKVGGAKVTLTLWKEGP